MDEKVKTLATEDSSGNSVYRGTRLCESYNTTYIEVLIRDPFWVFVYWEIRDSERRALSLSEGFGGYFLCVAETEGKELFQIELAPTDTERFLNFMPTREALCVELRAHLGAESRLIAVSRVFSMPPILERTFHGGDMPPAQAALTLLAGYNEIPVARNTLRASRLPRQMPRQMPRSPARSPSSQT